MSDVEVIPLVVAPPVILASATPISRLHPLHAARATGSDTKRLLKQQGDAQLRQQQRRHLPMTQQDFNQRAQQRS